MPFLCVTNQNVPAGVLQVLDLTPNESQLNPSISGPGQTKYVGPPTVGTSTTNQSATALTSSGVQSGLSAYIMDKVQPCSLEDSKLSLTVTTAGTVGGAGDTITISVPNAQGVMTDVVTLTAANAENNAVVAAAWNSDQNQDLTATSLSNMIGGAGAIRTAIDAAIVTGGLTGGEITTAIVGGNNIIFTCDVSNSAGGDECEVASQIGFAFAGAGVDGRYVGAGSVQAANETAADITPDSGSGLNWRMSRPVENWTSGSGVGSAQFAAQLVIDRMESGDTLTDALLTDLMIQATGTISVGGTSFVAAASNGSSGTLADVLSILSGRGYDIAGGETLYTTTLVNTLNCNLFAQADQGGFARQVTVSRSVQGNPVAPVNIVNREFAPIRLTVDGGSLNMSVGDGDLDQLYNSGWFKAYQGGAFQLGNGGVSGVALSAAGDPIRKYPYQGARANLFRQVGVTPKTPLPGVLSYTIDGAAQNTLAGVGTTFDADFLLDGVALGAQCRFTAPAGNSSAAEVATGVAAAINADAAVAAVVTATARGARVTLEADAGGRTRALDLAVTVATDSVALFPNLPPTPNGPRQQFTVPFMVAYNDDGSMKSILDLTNA